MRKHFLMLLILLSMISASVSAERLTVMQSEMDPGIELGKKYMDSDWFYEVKSMGGAAVDSNTVRLPNAKIDPLRDLLTRVPDGVNIILCGDLLRVELIQSLQSQFHEVNLLWEVSFQNERWLSNSTILDLSNVPLKHTGDLEKLLPYLPELQILYFGDNVFSERALMHLADRQPDLKVVWNMTLGGVTFSTDDTEIDLTGVQMQNTVDLERRIPYLTDAQKIILSDCGLDSQTLDELNQRCESVRIVWTVHLGSMNVRTDETWFMPTKYRKIVTTRDLDEFRYCTDMICVDIGHMRVDNCEWASYMPNLQYLILGETLVTDLTPLSGLKNLKFLELFTLKVTDFTPLLGCTGMEDLNLGLTYGDPDVIAQMTWLKNLWWCDANGYNNPARREAVLRMCEALPDTTIKIYIDHPTASGWRKLPNYYAMRDILGMFYLD